MLSSQAAAADSYTLIGGSEADSEGQSFSYIGAGVARPVSARYSLTGKVFAGYLRYKFDSDGTTYAAEMPMVTPSVGLQYGGDGFSLAGSAGADFRKTRRDTSTGATESSDSGAALQAEYYRWWGEQYSAGLIVSYSTIDSFFWARGRVEKGVHRTSGGTDIKLGGEVVGMGNSDFSAAGAGALVELSSTTSNLSVLFKAGLRSSSASSGALYGGFEAFYGF